MVIRPARADEAAEVRELVQRAYGHYVERIGRRPGPMDHDYDAKVAAGEIDVAERDGTVVGVIGRVPRDGALLVENVAVDPDRQGTGVGRELLAHAGREAARLGLGEVRLDTNVAMTENLAIYRHLGFREIGRGTRDGFERVFLARSLAGGPADLDAFVAAMEAKDVQAVMACLRPDVELRSPISRRIAFRGTAQVREVLEVVYATVGANRIRAVLGDGRTRVLVASSSVAGHPLDETFLLELDEDGLVARMTLYVRTMPQLVTFAAVLGARLARKRSRARALALSAMFAPLAAIVRAGEPLGVKLTGAGTPVDPAAPPPPLP